MSTLLEKKDRMELWFKDHLENHSSWNANLQVYNDLLEQINTQETMTTAYDLAKQTLDVLDIQQEYFKKRDPVILTRSKASEQQLRKTCEAIIAQQYPRTGSLFEQPKK